jgi:hypothetical protein
LTVLRILCLQSRVDEQAGAGSEPPEAELRQGEPKAETGWNEEVTFERSYRRRFTQTLQRSEMSKGFSGQLLYSERLDLNLWPMETLFPHILHGCTHRCRSAAARKQQVKFETSQLIYRAFSVSTAPSGKRYNQLEFLFVCRHNAYVRLLAAMRIGISALEVTNCPPSWIDGPSSICYMLHTIIVDCFLRT